MMAEANPKPLLDLDTLLERPVIAIDGDKWPILHADELSVLDSHRFGKWGKRIEELADDPSDDAEIELDALIDKTARKIMVGVPDDVFAKLSGSQKWDVIDLFTALRMQRTLTVAGAMQIAVGQEPTFSPIGAKSLPASSGSMAADRMTGWWTRLLHWFGRALK